MKNNTTKDASQENLDITITNVTEKEANLMTNQEGQDTLMNDWEIINLRLEELEKTTKSVLKEYKRYREEQIAK